MKALRPFLGLVAFLAFWPCYSSSEPFTHGTTNNAALNGLRWAMNADTLGVPVVPGMEVNGVLYRYTAVKEVEDPFKVTVSNENTSGGFIFSETDDWSGLPGNTINKFVPVELSRIGLWGDGAITTEGQGRVEDASVIYTFRIDECFAPENNPDCPGFIDPNQFVVATPDIEIYDSLSDENVLNTLEPTDPDLYEDKEEEADSGDEEDEDKKGDMEKALAAAQNALTLANTLSQDALVNAINATANISSYYAARIDGGAYKETQTLVDSHLPENRKGLRNGLAQQLLHEKMVDSQYR